MTFLALLETSWELLFCRPYAKSLVRPESHWILQSTHEFTLWCGDRNCSKRVNAATFKVLTALLLILKKEISNVPKKTSWTGMYLSPANMHGSSEHGYTCLAIVSFHPLSWACDLVQGHAWWYLWEAPFLQTASRHKSNDRSERNSYSKVTIASQLSTSCSAILEAHLGVMLKTEISSEDVLKTDLIRSTVDSKYNSGFNPDTWTRVRCFARKNMAMRLQITMKIHAFCLATHPINLRDDSKQWALWNGGLVERQLTVSM